jgi:hypothetical protein
MKSDVFTPENISKQMCSFLHPSGTLLEPSVGIGNLLKPLNFEKYKITALDINDEYLKQLPKSKNIIRKKGDFLKAMLPSESFHNIILNPPFIRIQNIPAEYREYLKERFPNLIRGNMDMYLAFLLKSLDLLHPEGKMVAITPSSYLFNKSSQKFRQYLIKNKLVERIIDFKSDKVFPDYDVYCAITVFSKMPKTDLIVNDEKIFYDQINPNYFHKNTDLNQSQTTNTSKIKIIKLKDIIRTQVGLATLRDKIFIHPDKKFEEPCWTPCYKVSKNKNMWIIYPYEDGKLIEENKFKSANPQTFAYLEENKDELMKRDKNQRTYVNWYAYGRSQSIVIPKVENGLYIPSMGTQKFPIYEDKPQLFIAGILITLLDDIDPNISLNDIKTTIENNKKYLYSISSKRKEEWFNISTSVIKELNLVQK